MRHYLIIFVLFTLCPVLPGQGEFENLTGKVSFISSQNVYVKFKSTEGISVGDTLYSISGSNLVPVIIVHQLSSSSCVCTPLSAGILSVDNLIVARIKKIPSKAGEKPSDEEKKAAPVMVISDTSSRSNKQANLQERKQVIRGSISAQSYSDFSNTIAGDSHRFRYTLSLDAQHIADSKFSAETYISFKHKQGEWDEVSKDLFNALKIYDLAIRYDLDKTMQFSLGRKINPRISSIGANDGLQVEKTFGRFSAGALAGTRPDYSNYGFNADLFQYGAYLAFNARSSDAYSGISLAFMQQMNNSNTDRRFLYFQYSQQLLKHLYIFNTFEIDLYKLANNVPQSTFDLTGMYFSLRYNLTKSFSLSGSYDARKNVIYYETYKTTTDSLFETEIRRSFRLMANYRITKNMTLGLQSGYRFLKSDPHPSVNVRGYFTYNQIPGIRLSTTIHATYLESNYMNGKILGMNVSRYFFKQKFRTELGYRFVDYQLPESSQKVTQNIGVMDLSWQFFKTMALTMYYEGAFEQSNVFHRLNLQVRKRF